MKEKTEWKIAVVGECMPVCALRPHEEPDFLTLKQILDGADVSCGHLEMTFGVPEDLYPSRGHDKLSFLQSDPRMAREMRWMGIKVLSTAGEHSFDFGPEGVVSTLCMCREANIVVAGSGQDLDEAREPSYYESSVGRVAMIATSSGNTSNEWANLSKGNMCTRPGTNPLRVKTRYVVPRDKAELLREMGRKLTVLREFKKGAPSKDLEEGEFRIMLPSEQSTHGAAGTVSVFKPGENYGVESVCHQGDLTGNLHSICEAAKIADMVIVSHNFCIADNYRGDQPPKFAVEFAHAAIDGGADVYIGHGWHKTLGVEIYRGKPIFYGIGNFIAQAPFVQPCSYNVYQNRGMDIALPKDSTAEAYSCNDAGCVQDENTLTSFVAEIGFSAEKKLREIIFYPIELGIDRRGSEVQFNRKMGFYAEGRPLLAHGETAQFILKRVQTLSQKFGTEIAIDGDIARWSMKI